jgi:hypothetical protein
MDRGHKKNMSAVANTPQNILIDNAKIDCLSLCSYTREIIN